MLLSVLEPAFISIRTFLNVIIGTSIFFIVIITIRTPLNVIICIRTLLNVIMGTSFLPNVSMGTSLLLLCSRSACCAQVRGLLQAIYRPQNFICIHVDKKSKPAFREAMQAMVSCLDNVFLSSRSVNVTWKTFTVLEADLICMKDLLQYKGGPFYFPFTVLYPRSGAYSVFTILYPRSGAYSVFTVPYPRCGAHSVFTVLYSTCGAHLQNCTQAAVHKFLRSYI